MPETPDEFHRRGLGASGPDGRLPVPEMVEWDVFPFEPAGLRVKEFQAPAGPEPPREGEGGRPCAACAGDPGRNSPDRIVWSDEHWTLTVLEPTGAPFVLMLRPIAHHDFPDLSDELAAELGALLVHVVRAVEALPHIARAHVSRWGDGGAHLHVFVYARPLGFSQLRGTMMAVWDDILPPTPVESVRADAAAVATALAASYGGSVQV